MGPPTIPVRFTGILRLLDADGRSGWMVTEYHEEGTLADHPATFKGDAVRALHAFEIIVAAVDRIHGVGAIHRDIKPANVFLSRSGDLVLGDVGIVFWSDEKHQRLTETYERVGSRDWMAPWANRGRRLANINATFDIFPLGKLLWSMLSGEHELPYWYWDQPDYDLTRMFPNDPAMYTINTRILRDTIVQFEPQCVQTASELLVRVRAVASLIERGGQLPAEQVRRCRVCGWGHYKD